MRAMKSLIISIIFSLGWAASAFGQDKTDEMIETVRAMGQWAQAYSKTVDEMIPLFMGETMDEVLAALDSDDEVVLKSAVQKYSMERISSLKSMREAMDAIPPVPDLEVIGYKGKKLEKALNFQLKQLSVIYDEAAEASGYLDTMLGRTSKGDDSGLTQIIKQQFLATIRLLEAENFQVDAAILAIPKNNPNYNFQIIVKAQNVISIEELRMNVLSLERAIELPDRVEYNQVIKTQLDIISQNLKSGRRKIKATTNAMEANKKVLKNKSQVAFLEKVVRALDTFHQQFAIEEKMYDQSKKSYEIYIREGSSDDYSEAIEANDDEFTRLAFERFKIMDERFAILAQ